MNVEMVAGKSTGQDGDQVSLLARNINDRLRDSINAIELINSDIKVLSINGKIQAARVGQSGAGFAIVAGEVANLAGRTKSITDDLQRGIESTVTELLSLGREVRGKRFAQVSASVIDVIDRNLYERSCDVRWWAQDAAVVDALAGAGQGDHATFASRRMGIILSAYTVYFDILLCDSGGRILANGRPGEYAVQGQSMAQEEWFRQAQKRDNPEGYACSAVHRSRLVKDRFALVFSAPVEVPGKGIQGVLAVVFNWQALAREAVMRAEQTLKSESTKPVRVVVADPEGTCLASGREEEQLAPVGPGLRSTKRTDNQGFSLAGADSGSPSLVAWAESPGFETYRSNWTVFAWEAD